MSPLGNQSVLVKNTLYEVMNSCFPDSNREAATRILALLAFHDIGAEKCIVTLKELCNQHIYTRIFAEAPYFTSGRLDDFILLSGNDDWTILDNDLRDVENQFDELFIPVASFSLVSEVVHFLDQRPLSRVIQRALLKGKKVTMIEDAINPYSSTIRKAGLDQSTNLLKNELFNHYKKLQGFGVTFIHSDQVSSHFQKQITSHKRLVSEEVVLKAKENQQQEIIIPKETLITPLARDTAKELGIRLTIE